MWRKYSKKLYDLMRVSLFVCNLDSLNIPPEEMDLLKQDLQASNEELLAAWEEALKHWKLYGAPADQDGYGKPAYPEPKKPDLIDSLPDQLLKNIVREILEDILAKWPVVENHAPDKEAFFMKEFSLLPIYEKSLFILKTYHKGWFDFGGRGVEQLLFDDLLKCRFVL